MPQRFPWSSSRSSVLLPSLHFQSAKGCPPTRPQSVFALHSHTSLWEHTSVYVLDCARGQSCLDVCHVGSQTERVGRLSRSWESRNGWATDLITKLPSQTHTSIVSVSILLWQRFDWLPHWTDQYCFTVVKKLFIKLFSPVRNCTKVHLDDNRDPDSP